MLVQGVADVAGNVDAAGRIVDFVLDGPGSAPVAVLGCDVEEANSPARITFSAVGSHDPGGQALSFAWSFGDGSAGSGPWIRHD
jgi:hypothetical protein